MERSVPEEMVDWIDDAGNTRESLPRSEIRRRNLLHRVSATLIFHPDGRLLIHRRAQEKDVFPGLHDCFVGGTVASGESFADNAYREVAEEMGVHGAPLYELFDHRFRNGQVNNYTVVFACRYDGPFTFQAGEVAEGGWSDHTRVDELVKEGNLCPDSAQGWQLYQARPDGGFLQRLAEGRLTPVDRGATTPGTIDLPQRLGP